MSLGGVAIGTLSTSGTAYRGGRLLAVSLASGVSGSGLGACVALDRAAEILYGSPCAHDCEGGCHDRRELVLDVRDEGLGLLLVGLGCGGVVGDHSDEGHHVVPAVW